MNVTFFNNFSEFLLYSVLCMNYLNMPMNIRSHVVHCGVKQSVWHWVFPVNSLKSANICNIVLEGEGSRGV
jgi:hypothetical protein